MELRVISQGRLELPALGIVQQPILDLTRVPLLTFCVIEGGMTSGEPSVIIACESPGRGTVFLQTSLDKLMMGAQACAGIATERWGWERPEGYASFLPASKEAAKAMLESIKKELEEWVGDEEVEDGTEEDEFERYDDPSHDANPLFISDPVERLNHITQFVCIDCDGAVKLFEQKETGARVWVHVRSRKQDGTESTSEV